MIPDADDDRSSVPVIRRERPDDVEAVDRVARLAFGQEGEGRLIRTLRDQGAITIGLVAEVDATVVGQISFSPARIEWADGEPQSVIALGPMGVVPNLQKRGIGGRLIEAGLAECRAAGEAVVVVLGHVAYYPRFGFEPAAQHGLRCEFDVPSEAFMVRLLEPARLSGRSGVVKYHAAFHDV